MAWTVANPVTIGNPTKKSDYDKLFDNCDFFKIEHNTDGTHKYPLTAGTAVASPSGTAIDFTSIPSWVKRITINFDGVSTNGTSPILIQIGDAGGVETSGYVASAMVHDSVGTSTAGFILLVAAAAASLHHGSVVLSLLSATAFEWVAEGVLSRSTDGALHLFAGGKSLSATLDRVRITMVNGTDIFDAGGAINILYE